MYYIAIYYNPNNNSYYYRKYYSFHQHDVGYVNGYGHEVILVIDLCFNEKISIRKRLITGIIRFLEKLKE